MWCSYPTISNGKITPAGQVYVGDLVEIACNEVCMSICVYVYIHIHTYIYTHMCAYLYTHIHAVHVTNITRVCMYMQDCRINDDTNRHMYQFKYTWVHD